MNSFTLTAVGNLARNPEMVAKGDSAHTRFCLVGTDYAGRDEEGVPREVVTSLWFVAFGSMGEAIARHSRKGDQLIVEARIRSNIWTDKQGEKQYDHSFVVQGFKFGAPGKTKREERFGRRDETLTLPRAEDSGVGGSPASSVDVASSADEKAAPEAVVTAVPAAEADTNAGSIKTPNPKPAGGRSGRRSATSAA